MMSDILVGIVIILIAPALAGGVAVRPLTNWTKGLLNLSGKRFRVGEFVLAWPDVVAAFYSLLSGVLIAVVEFNVLDGTVISAENAAVIVPTMIGAAYLSARGFYKNWRNSAA